jgi:hypothetical protein
MFGLHAWPGFPVNIFYAARIEGVGLAQATYVFDPSTFVQDERCKEMRYRPTVESVFSVVVVLHREGWIETLKYRESDLICEACGPDFRTAMIHATMCGVALDEPRTCVENSTTEPGRIGETLNLRLGHWASSPEDTRSGDACRPALHGLLQRA